ncbi:hypothetical protein AaE_015851 [Aphanomyces astaci]|uniref:DUF7769 domain-containing protein n=1 Tax=Aphanomyces astaci TaxID=112090 RepID=A0A6A4YYA5_APHAT|nr:hypothetical protein AaE_015851 [Aphanomyces astaci]
MRELTSDQRRAVVNYLLLRVAQAPCKLHRGAINEVAKIFGTNRHNVADIWGRANVSLGGEGLPTTQTIRNNMASLKKGLVEVHGLARTHLCRTSD